MLGERILSILLLH